MTVAELIAHLQTLPQDFPIVFCCRSDYDVLRANEIKVQRSTDELKKNCVIAHHNRPGEFRDYCGPAEYKGQPLPKPADVVIFPCN